MLTALLLLACSGSASDPDIPPPVSDDPSCEVGVAEGDCAPDFELPDADGGVARLSDHLGKRVLVLGSAFW